MALNKIKIFYYPNADRTHNHRASNTFLLRYDKLVNKFTADRGQNRPHIDFTPVRIILPRCKNMRLKRLQPHHLNNS